MNKKYYVNNDPQYNGDHEVHDEYCIFLPSKENRKYVGDFYSCKAAVTAAKNFYPTADGCKWCSAACHNR